MKTAQSRARRLTWRGLVALAAFVWAAPAAAQDAPQSESSEAADASAEDLPTIVFARVIVDRTTLRSGPGPRFRSLRSASRGDVFPILERGTRGYWFRVELPDATSAWIQGDTVYTHEMTSEEASQGRFGADVFAPAPLAQAVGEFAIGFGALGRAYGFMAVRPTFFIAPEFGIEATAAAAVGVGGRLMIGTLGGVVNIFPSSPIVPFLGAGGGFVVSDPNADTFLLQSGLTGALYAGGGFRISFRYRITLRLEARFWAFYDENRYIGQEELSGGLTVFF